MGNIRQSTKATQAEIIEARRQEKLDQLQAENELLKTAIKEAVKDLYHSAHDLKIKNILEQALTNHKGE